MSELSVIVVSDEPCPGCGKPGRPKVGHEDGTWAWRCPTPWPECKVGYYTPGQPGRTEPKLPPDEEAALSQRISEQLARDLAGKVMIHRVLGHGVTEGTWVSPEQLQAKLAEGWAEGPAPL